MLTAHAHTPKHFKILVEIYKCYNKNLLYIASQQQLSYYPDFDYLKKRVKLDCRNKTSPKEPVNSARTCIPPRTRYPGQNQATLLGQGVSVKTR